MISSWDDDVVFKNQARGTDEKRKKEFVNVCVLCPPLPSSRCASPSPPSIQDCLVVLETIAILILRPIKDLLRSDFHKRFMVRGDMCLLLGSLLLHVIYSRSVIHSSTLSTSSPSSPSSTPRTALLTSLLANFINSLTDLLPLFRTNTFDRHMTY